MNEDANKQICLDQRFSTTRSLYRKPLQVLPDLPDMPNRIASGGLRLNGYYPATNHEKINQPLVSIITVVYNGSEFIDQAIKSVLTQSYNNIEYIIIDGGSTDGTLEIIRRYENNISLYVSEPDDGIYTAMNKGLKLATGYIVGILNADDVYADTDVIYEIATVFMQTSVDSVISDLVIVDREDINSIKRYYKSDSFVPEKLAYGWMPAHPAFFVKNECYRKHGLFKTDYKIAADYELLVRFLSKNRITYHYIDRVVVKMRAGGVSSRNITSNWVLNREIVRACRENGVKTNIFKVLSKYPAKILQYYKRPL